MNPLWSLETRAFLPAGPEGLQALDIVHPVRVDAGGAFLSYDLRPRTLRKRAVSAHRAVHTFYELQFRGRPLRFHLAANTHLLAPGFVSETRRTGGLGRTHIRTRWQACHLLGKVQDPELEGGMAAISACDGLVSARPRLGLTWWLWPFPSPETQWRACRMGVRTEAPCCSPRLDSRTFVCESHPQAKLTRRVPSVRSGWAPKLAFVTVSQVMLEMQAQSPTWGPRLWSVQTKQL